MGKTINNRYRIIKKIGEGGMGAVYLAEDMRLDRKVAIKRLHLVGRPTDIQMFQERFEREAKVMAGFQHPNIVSVFDYGQDAEGVYLVLEYMPGGALDQRMRGEPMSVQDGIDIILPIADALQAIHALGRVHRDIKPANILFDPYGNPKVADFGVVKLLENKIGDTLTAAGAAVGTPAYMAPELVDGTASPAADQYALGIVFYEMVTGKKPYKGRTPMETMYMQKVHPLPDPISTNPELPGWICDFLQKTLAKEPQNRFTNMRSFMMGLRNGGYSAPVMQEEPTMTAVPIQAAPTQQETPSVESPVIQQRQTILETSPIHQQQARVEPKQKEKKSCVLWGIIGIAAVAVLVVVGLILFVVGGNLIESAQEKQSLEMTVEAFSASHTQPPLEPFETRESDGMEMAFIPEGAFLMGGGNEQDREGPVHEVYLDDYWIDRFEVSNAQYLLCVEDDVCDPPAYENSMTREEYFGNESYADYPVIITDWEKAAAYCQWAGGRLPTEAEWEKAARGVEFNTYPWGEEKPTCEKANFGGEDGCVGDTAIVGGTPNGASPYGVMDMTGNVSEWMNDWYDYDYYKNSPLENPAGPESGTCRVIRGGSWNGEKDILYTANRWCYTPDDEWNTLGFRCIVDAGDGD